MTIEAKQVSKLTDEERKYLIDLYRNGEEDERFKVVFNKNGSSRIVKKKQPVKTLSSKLLDKNDTNRRNPSLTTEQLLMEHVIDLESKYATLIQKHKKLKKCYKSMHEDLYVDDEEALPTVKAEMNTESETVSTNQINEQESNHQTNETESMSSNIYPRRIRNPNNRKGYRSLMSLN